MVGIRSTRRKLLIKRVGHQLGTFIATCIVIGAAVGFYVVMKGTTEMYRSTAEQYFSSHALPDYLLKTTGFGRAEVAAVQQLPGVKAAYGRSVVDAARAGDTLRVQSVPANPDINIPHLYSGRLPVAGDEVALANRYARSNHIAIGDTIDITYAQRTYTLRVVGLSATPEYVYLSKNVSVPMANPDEFGVALVTESFAARLLMAPYPYNELLVRLDGGGPSGPAAIQRIKEAVGLGRVVSATEREDQFSYDAYKADLEQFEIFSYIFPVVFMVVAGMVLFVTQKRSIIQDRRQIGIMKALGLKNTEITIMYQWYGALLAAAGVALGIGLSVFIGPAIVQEFGDMIEVPGFAHQNLPGMWVLPAAVALSICLLATYASVRPIARIYPAEAMHAETSVAGKNIWLQRTWLWRLLSAHSRYSIKSALRNRARFFAMVLGIAATVALTTLSIGFYDTFHAVVGNFYDKVARYDVIAYMSPVSYGTQPAFLENTTAYQKAFIKPVTLEHDGIKQEMPLVVADDIFAMFGIESSSGGRPNATDGLAIPEYYAGLLHVSSGGTVRVTSADNTVDARVTIRDTTTQRTSFKAVAGREFGERAILGGKSQYNALFMQTTDPDALKQAVLRAYPNASVTTRAEDRATLTKMLSTFNIYIIILLAFSVLLGVAVLYSVSSISLLARQYEFVLLRVQGYSVGLALMTYLKELSAEVVIALPVGFLAGIGLLRLIEGAFSMDSYQMVAYVAPASYLYVTAITTAVLGVVVIIAWRFIARLDFVAGLKSREE